MKFKICVFKKDITTLKLHKEGKMVKNTLLCPILASVRLQDSSVHWK